MRVKLSVLRSSEEDSCPFGLDIPYACSNVGKTINKMAPLDIMGPDSSEQEREEIAKANNHLFIWNVAGDKCPYANEIFENGVVCTFSEEGHGTSPIVGSPFYAKHFSGIGLDGLYSVPLSSYVDTSIDRGSYWSEYTIAKDEQT